MEPQIMMTFTCPRCYGAGHFKHWRHIDGGRCFRCEGSGVVEVPRDDLFDERNQRTEETDQ